MPYIFVVDGTNLKKCLKSRLFGVPNTARAYSQILPVKENQTLFLYEYGAKRIHGIYKAKSGVFTEKNPSAGPWTGRKRDEKAGYYPHRIEIEITQYYQTGIEIAEVERSGLGLDRHSFNGKSCVYITEEQAEEIINLLKKANPEGPSEPPTSVPLQSNKKPVALADLSGEKEEKLQVLVQQNIKKLGKLGLEMEVLDSYFNITECMSCKTMCTLDYAGQIDILGMDVSKKFVVLELKAGEAKKAIVRQLEKYASVVRKTFAQENADVVRAIICGSSSRELVECFRQRRIMAFKHDTDFESYIDFEPLV